MKSQDFLDPDFFDRYMWVQDPSKVGVSIISLMFMWVLDPHTSVGKIWIHKILALQTLIYRDIFIFIKIHIQ